MIPEAAYLVRTRLGVREERAFIKGFPGSRIAVEPLRDADLTRAAALTDEYPDLGFTDCAVVAMAERLALTAIATTDRRHFAAVQPRHATHFALVP